jgi:hypothetical protein
MNTLKMWAVLSLVMMVAPAAYAGVQSCNVDINCVFLGVAYYDSPAIGQNDNILGTIVGNPSTSLVVTFDWRPNGSGAFVFTDISTSCGLESPANPDALVNLSLQSGGSTVDRLKFIQTSTGLIGALYFAPFDANYSVTCVQRANQRKGD